MGCLPGRSACCLTCRSPAAGLTHFLLFVVSASGSSGTHRCASSPVLSAGEAPSSPPSRTPASSGLLASPLARFHRLTMLFWLPPAGLLALFLVPVPRKLGELCVPDRVLWLRVRAGGQRLSGGSGSGVCSHQTLGGLGLRLGDVCPAAPEGAFLAECGRVPGISTFNLICARAPRG